MHSSELWIRFHTGDSRAFATVSSKIGTCPPKLHQIVICIRFHTGSRFSDALFRRTLESFRTRIFTRVFTRTLRQLKKSATITEILRIVAEIVEMGGIEPPSLCGAEHHKCRSCGGHRRDRRAWLRRPWAVAGPGRASSRRAERSSRRGRRAGGPPPTGASSSPTQHGTQREAARPHRDQAAHASGDSCQKPRISRRSRRHRRGRQRR